MLSQKHSACILAAVLLLASASGCSVKTDNTASADPLTITVWTYYNGDQLASFERLVEEFNTTSYSDAHSISMKVLPCPKFADGEAYAVQQGAGMVVTQGSEQEIKACVTFLKWFTAPENNITFSVDSSYLPDNQTV